MGRKPKAENEKREAYEDILFDEVFLNFVGVKRFKDVDEAVELCLDKCKLVNAFYEDTKLFRLVKQYHLDRLAFFSRLKQHLISKYY